MDPSFVLRHRRKLSCLPTCALRRDPNFTPQLYFSSIEVMGSKFEFGLYFSQVVAASGNDGDQSVRAATFLKRKRTSDVPIADISFAIDERAAKFYLSFANDPIGSESKLRIMDIEFDPADHLGYRRVRVKEQDRFFVVKATPSPSLLGLAYLTAIQVCPATGKLFGIYSIPGFTSKSVPARFEEESEAKNSVIKATLAELGFVSYDTKSIDLVCSCFLFSKLNHLMILHTFPKPTPENQQTNKFMYLRSFDTNLNLVQCLPFNPVDFVSQFMPEVGHDFEEKYQLSSESVVGHCLYILGLVHKYVLFYMQPTYVLAVKWPKNWYSYQNLPTVQLSRVIALYDYKNEDDEYIFMPPMDAVTLTKTHLYFIHNLQDKPKEIRRLVLSPKLKDHRHCANCGEMETRKRRNKYGKRIAKFKVCRLCKERNFHLFYLDPEIACHYCSDECQKKHWKIHKDIHKRSKLDRETASAKTVKEKL